MQQLQFAKDLRKNQTNAEKIIWYRLRNRQFFDLKFRRQQPIKGYIVDFICFEKKLIIELDGGQHNKEEGKISDNIRTNVLEKEGFIVLRFWNNEILKDLNGVLEKVLQVLNTTPHPNLSPKGRGDNR